MTSGQMKILRRALGCYGIEHQTLILAEECAEVVKASTKLVRQPDLSTDNLAEEVADVLIMLEQMCLWYGIEEEKVASLIEFKVDRLESRMKKKFKEKYGTDTAGDT